VALVGLAGAAVASATASSAAIGPECFGDSSIALCATVDPAGLPTVDPTGGDPVGDCIFVGPPPCTPVEVPTPSVTPGSGALVILECIGPACPNPDVRASR
jgi:hypothetical protein